MGFLVAAANVLQKMLIILFFYVKVIEILYLKYLKFFYLKNQNKVVVK